MPFLPIFERAERLEKVGMLPKSFIVLKSLFWL